MNRSHRMVLCFGVTLLVLGVSRAAPPQASPAAIPDEAVQPPPGPELPGWTKNLSFAGLGSTSDVKLSGINNNQSIGFGVRRDRVVTAAVLHLQYTPSPSLVPVLSQLRIYLNDALTGVLTIDQPDLGHPVRRDVPLNPQLLTDFNQLRIELVGQYAAACENPASSTLWLNLARDSSIELKEQALATGNDLAWFPSPFFDQRSNDRLVLPMVFPAAPTLDEQKAAAVLASYFGTLAAYRGVSFPATFGQLPALPASGVPLYLIAFATNNRRPAFLSDVRRYAPVKGPTIELADNPGNPYIKMLLVRGRDDADLLTAVRALASDGELMRGSRVVIDGAHPLTPRQPYDAPEWVPTNRPVKFIQMTQSPEQLQTQGLPPYPVGIEFKLPPDLFVWHGKGVALHLAYRYTRPARGEGSNLNFFVNNRFFTSLPLSVDPGAQGDARNLRLNLLSADSDAQDDDRKIPDLTLQGNNRLRFDFNYAIGLGSVKTGYCETRLPTALHAEIGDASTLDVSGYYHYMAMPNLHAFSQSGWPFSRMADLSQTMVVVPREPTAISVSTMLSAIGQIGAEIGYPAFGLRLTDDWKTAAGADADLLVLGPMPRDLREAPTLPLLLGRSRNWLEQAAGSSNPTSTRIPDDSLTNGKAGFRTDVNAGAPIAAIIGMPSPFHVQRSVVALLASTPADYQLLQTTLADPGKRAAVSGSVALIRSSGIYSQFVGDPYYVGHLPWWLLLWYKFSGHPVLLAVFAAVSASLLGLVLRQLLRGVTRRRLSRPG